MGRGPILPDEQILWTGVAEFDRFLYDEQLKGCPVYKATMKR